MAGQGNSLEEVYLRDIFNDIEGAKIKPKFSFIKITDDIEEELPPQPLQQQPQQQQELGFTGSVPSLGLPALGARIGFPYATP